MRRWLAAGALGLVAGCASSTSDRVAYTEALHAKDLEGAWGACGRVQDPDQRGDCEGSVAERFSAWDRCDQMDEGRWRDECHFMAAEDIGRHGDIAAALKACSASAYAEQCGDHVLGIWVMSHLQDDTAALSTSFAAFAPLLAGPRIENQFWRSYFRNRIARGLPIDASGCQDKACRGAAQVETMAAIRELQDRTGPSFCASPPAPPVWATTDQTRRWVTNQITRGCDPAAASGMRGPNGELPPPPLSPGGAPLPPAGAPLP